MEYVYLENSSPSYSSLIPRLPRRMRKRAIFIVVILAALAIMHGCVAALQLIRRPYNGPMLANFTNLLSCMDIIIIFFLSFHHCGFLTVNLNAFESTCSEFATDRGPHQRVISFSFYGNPKHKRDYFPVSLNITLFSTHPEPRKINNVLCVVFLACIINSVYTSTWKA
jgi:hypothetical protein